MRDARRESSSLDHTSLALAIPPELVEAVAVRVAELVAERLPAPVEPYMTVERAAEYLASPKSRVYELVEQGRVRHFRDGRRVLLRRADLDDALDVREAE